MPGAAEVGGQDTWQRAELGLCGAGTDRPRVRAMIESAVAFIEELHLDGTTPADITDGAPLFGEGLGLETIKDAAGNVIQMLLSRVMTCAMIWRFLSWMQCTARRGRLISPSVKPVGPVRGLVFVPVINRRHAQPVMAGARS